MLIYYEFFVPKAETMHLTTQLRNRDPASYREKDRGKGGYGILVVRIDGEAGEVDGAWVVLAPGRIADASTPQIALPRQRQGRRLHLFRADGGGARVDDDAARREASANRKPDSATCGDQRRRRGLGGCYVAGLINCKWPLQ